MAILIVWRLSMRKWILLLILGVLFAFPVRAFSQAEIAIASVEINLWPEYDRAEMLVIDYILLAPDTQLPATIDMRVPAEVGAPHVVAVGASPELVTDQGVKFMTRTEGEWLVVSIQASGPAIQLEYYDPGLKKDGVSRSYTYEWLSDYKVQNLVFTVQQPFDATGFNTSPALQDDGIHQDQLQYYLSQTVGVPAGKSISIELNYEKPSDVLSVSRLQVQPEDVDENTPGRVSFSNSLPYVIGGLGVVLIIGGIVYYWQSGRSGSRKPRRRARAHADNEEGKGETYCHQCGARAHGGDRFCRTCGARLRLQEE
jgi:hypothetical protein